MTTHSDLCLWCNKDYGSHRAGSFHNCCTGQDANGNYTWEPNRIFVLQGSRALAYFPIGTKISYYVNKNSDIIENPKDTRSIDCGMATIRALTNPATSLSGSGDTMLLVWERASSHIPGGAWDVHTTIPEYVKLMTPGDAYGYWVSKDTPVKMVVSVTGTRRSAVMQVVEIPKGMHCCRSDCRSFNEYAEPNQPDGKFICYSCRQRGW